MVRKADEIARHVVSEVGELSTISRRSVRAARI